MPNEHIYVESSRYYLLTNQVYSPSRKYSEIAIDQEPAYT